MGLASELKRRSVGASAARVKSGGGPMQEGQLNLRGQRRRPRRAPRVRGRDYQWPPKKRVGRAIPNVKRGGRYQPLQPNRVIEENQRA